MSSQELQFCGKMQPSLTDIWEMESPVTNTPCHEQGGRGRSKALHQHMHPGCDGLRDGVAWFLLGDFGPLFPSLCNFCVWAPGMAWCPTAPSHCSVFSIRPSPPSLFYSHKADSPCCMEQWKRCWLALEELGLLSCFCSRGEIQVWTWHFHVRPLPHPFVHLCSCLQAQVLCWLPPGELCIWKKQAIAVGRIGPCLLSGGFPPCT